MTMNHVQFQPGLFNAEFFQRYGTEERCEATLLQSRWPVPGHSSFECWRRLRHEAARIGTRHLVSQTPAVAATVHRRRDRACEPDHGRDPDGDPRADRWHLASRAGCGRDGPRHAAERGPGRAVRRRCRKPEPAGQGNDGSRRPLQAEGCLRVRCRSVFVVPPFTTTGIQCAYKLTRRYSPPSRHSLL